MNRRRAIVVTVATWLFWFPGLHGEEKDAGELLVARGGARVSLQCGDVRLDGALKMRADGVASEQWQVAMDCVARLEVVRVRRPVGISDAEILALRLTLTNRSGEMRTVPVIVSLAPSSLTAPGLRALAFERQAFSVKGQLVLAADTPSWGAILAESAFAPRPLTPQEVAHVTSTEGECRGEMVFDLRLAAGQSQVIALLAPAPLATSPDVPVGLEFLRKMRVDEFFSAVKAP